MIIKVKSEEIVKGLQLVSGGKKGTYYRVKPTELSQAIKAVYEQTGVWKIKVIIEDSKDVLEDGNVTKKVKKNQQEIISLAVGDKVKILNKEKNIKKFFKAIGFEDEGDIAYKFYKGFAKCSEYEIENAHNIYSQIWNETFPSVEYRNDSEEFSMLRASIKKWWDTTEYTSLYRILPYNEFLKFILRNTGYNI